MFPWPRFYPLGEDGESVGDRSERSRASSMNSIQEDQEVQEAQSGTSLLNLKYDTRSCGEPRGGNPGEEAVTG